MKRRPFLLMLWSTNRTMLLILGALLAVNLFVFSLGLLVVTPQLERAERELVDAQRQLRRGKGASPRQAFAQRGKDFERFRLLLPSNRNFSELIGDLYGLAANCNLDIGQINYMPKALPEMEMPSSALKFSVTGTYDELKRFIYGLEESKRIVVLDQMVLNAAKGEEGEALVRLELSLTTYFAGEGGR